MSDSNKKYIVRFPEDEQTNDIKELEYEESEKEKFFEFLNKKNKSLKKEKASVIIQNNGNESQMYLIRNKILFEDNNGELICLDIKNGNILKTHKYNIIKDKNGNNKYITKKDGNNYYRYSLIDGHLIDSINKKPFRKNFIYKVYDKNNKTFKEINLGNLNNIDEAIENVRYEKTEKIDLSPEYQYEKIFKEELGIYPTIENITGVLTRFNEPIKKLCIEKNLSIDIEKYNSISVLLDKLRPLAKEEGYSAECYALKYIFDKYKEDVERFRKIEHGLFAQRGKINIYELEIKNLDESVSIQQAFNFNKENELRVLKNKKGEQYITIGGKIAGVTVESNISDEKQKKYGHRYYYVKPVGEPMYIFEKTKGDFSNHSNFPESELNPDRLIETAGSITIKNGKITNISNSSGHFKPSPETIYRALEIIASMTTNCDIIDLVDTKFILPSGGCKIISDVKDIFELQEVKQKQILWYSCIEEVAKETPKHEIIKINSKASRIATKENNAIRRL